MTPTSEPDLSRWTDARIVALIREAQEWLRGVSPARIREEQRAGGGTEDEAVQRLAAREARAAIDRVLRHVRADAKPVTGDAGAAADTDTSSQQS